MVCVLCYWSVGVLGLLGVAWSYFVVVCSESAVYQHVF